MMLTCDSAIFPVGGGEYIKVCGKIKAYPFAYHCKKVTAINDSYVCGVSVPTEHLEATYGHLLVEKHVMLVLI